jgi:hypothetical protein
VLTCNRLPLFADRAREIILGPGLMMFGNREFRPGRNLIVRRERYGILTKSVVIRAKSVIPPILITEYFGSRDSRTA